MKAGKSVSNEINYTDPGHGLSVNQLVKNITSSSKSLRKDPSNEELNKQKYPNVKPKYLDNSHRLFENIKTSKEKKSPRRKRKTTNDLYSLP